MKEICTLCKGIMKKKLLDIVGVKALGYECSKCKDKIFTSEQMTNIAKLVDQKRLKENYKKKPVIIGNSIGVIFPKTAVEVFGIDPKKTELNFEFDKVKNKITITVL